MKTLFEILLFYFLDREPVLKCTKEGIFISFKKEIAQCTRRIRRDPHMTDRLYPVYLKQQSNE